MKPVSPLFIRLGSAFVRALLVALLPLPLALDVRGAERPYARAGQVDARIQSEIQRQEIVGLALVVIDGGTIAWSKGYGFADREKQVRVDPAVTQFRWASISKCVTAIAALQLVENGRLDLDADVRTYVPEFPDKGKGATISSRALLSHRSGIVHYRNGPVIRTEKAYSTPHPFADVVVALDTFKESPLLHPPGTKFAYTTHGYILLSAVVERAGKQRFADQVAERIARPLGMSQFRPDYQWEDIPHRAAGYRRQNGAIERRPEDQVEDVGWKLGGGGFTSPATDLARFGIGLLQRKLVSEATERLMWTGGETDKTNNPARYGLGFYVIPEPDGRILVGHDGSQAKAKTALILDPQAKKGIALMTSSEWVDPMPIAMKLLEEIREERPRPTDK